MPAEAEETDEDITADSGMTGTVGRTDGVLEEVEVSDEARS